MQRRTFETPVSRRLAVALALALAFAAMIVLARAGDARAVTATPAPGWALELQAQPTSFAIADDSSEAVKDDHYFVLATNQGAAPSSGPVTIRDEVPSGVKIAANGSSYTYYAEDFSKNLETAEKPTCTGGERQIKCTFAGAVPGGDVLEIRLPVEVEASASAGPLAEPDRAWVEGGGAPSQEAHVASSVKVPQQFEFLSFGMEPYTTAGTLDAQADDHPYTVSTSFQMTSLDDLKSGGGAVPVEYPKAVVAYLPVGLVGAPSALTKAQCSLAVVEEEPEACPAASRVGNVILGIQGEVASSVGDSKEYSPLYNVAPEDGYPAEFVFVVDKKPGVLYGSVVRMPGAPGGYGLRVATPGVPVVGIVHLTGLTINFFGDPAEADGEPSASAAYFTNPDDCDGGPVKARIEADSWEDPSRWVSDESVVYPEVSGCGALSFDPTIGFTPTGSPIGQSLVAADEPSGFSFGMQIPQTANVPDELATPDLKDATVTLPEGVSISPAAANGLVACKAEGPEGINIGEGEASAGTGDPGDPEAVEKGEGHLGVGGNGSRYDDGLYHVARGHCPSESRIGTVDIKSPLIEEELKGGVFLAQPAKCATGADMSGCSEAAVEDGEVFGLYLEAEAESDGIIVKVPGSVEVGGYGQHSKEEGLAPGQIRARFDENPQLPFSELKLETEGGPKAPLATPQSCGSFTTTSTLTAWSEGFTPSGESFGTATPSVSPFTVDWNGAGEACPGTPPFAPSFTAGSTVTQGGASPSFTIAFSRKDREQDLSGVTVNMPPGLVGEIAKATQCGETQANEGTCPESSKIGTATVYAGAVCEREASCHGAPAGSSPYKLTGSVYLTGPYKGDPFGLSVAVPTVAGPFTLPGNTAAGGLEVVRAAIAVNPQTAAVTVVSEPLPQIVDGVPIRLQQVDVEVNKPSFMLNPTNCAAMAVTGTLSGALPSGAAGTSVGDSTPFAATGCKGLAFKPGFKVSTQAKVSRRDGASLKVTITQKSGEANLHQVDVQLPKILPSRLETLKLACTEQQFNANPAACPAESKVGMAVVHTPILNAALEGPAILVSHGGEAFPDLDLVLQGEGVTIIATGHTQIKKGITYSRFETIPDTPVSSVEVNLPQGRYSVLGAPAAKGSLCGRNLLMPTTIVGQNGAQVEQQTRIEPEGCSKTLSVRGHHIKKRTLTLKVYAPGAGKLKVSGKGVRSQTRKLGHMSIVTVKVHEKKARSLKTKVNVVFTPSSGKSRKRQVKSLPVRFKAV